MAAVSGTTLEAQVRREADIENETSRHPEAVVYKQITYAVASLYRKLGISDPHSYLTKVDSSQTTTADNPLVGVPADFRSLRGLDIKLGGDWERVLPLPHRFRNSFQDIVGLQEGRRTYYQIEGTDTGSSPMSVRLYPTPTASHSLRFWYVPTEPVVDEDSDSVELFGFEEYVVVVASIGIKRRDDLPIEDLRVRKEELEEEIRSFAGKVDVSTEAGMPRDARRKSGRSIRERWEDVT